MKKGVIPCQATQRNAIQATEAGKSRSQFCRDFQFSTVYAPIPTDFAEIVVADASKLQDYVWHELGKDLGKEDFVDQLSTIQAPTLVRESGSPLAGQARVVAPFHFSLPGRK